MGELRFTMRRRIYIIFLLCVLLPVVFLSAFLSFYFAQKSIAFARQNAANMLLTSSKSIEICLDELERISFTPYLYRDIFEAMRLMNGNVSSSGSDILTQNRLEENYSITFTKLLHTVSPKVYRIAFYPLAPEENICYWLTRNRAGLKVAQVPPFEQSDWFASAAARNGQIFYSGFFSTEGDEELQSKTCFSAVRIIRDSDAYKNIGVLKLEISPEGITDVLDSVILPKNSYLLLMNDKNELIYSSKELSGKVARCLEQTELPDFAAWSSPYYIAQQPIGNTGWKLVSFTAQNDIILSNTSTFLLIALVALAAAGGALLVYRYNSIHIVTSLNTILSTIREIERGNLSVQCEVREKSELALVASALTRMSKRLDNHLEKEYRAIVNQRNAEYLALQSQINPHFLYNTLNGFIALNRMGEQKLLEQNIIQFTHLFRYTCDNRNTVALGEELDFIESYLELQRLRFDDRLIYRMNADADARGLIIPKLLLQPIVENSIIHGMKNSGEAIHIRIACEKQIVDGVEGLLLAVEDDGAGFDAEAVISNTTHVGLANIMERVVYFNSHGKFDISSSLGSGTHCRIWLPSSKKEAE